MIHLALDTCIYRSKPRLDSKEFVLLKGMAVSGTIILHVPFVVEREFTTQLEHDQRDKLTRAINLISRALNFEPHGPHSAKLAGQLDGFKSALHDLVQERHEVFMNWLLEVHAIRHPLTLEQTSNAMEAYFAGAPPLKQPKVRNDIPDSFIFQQFLQLNEDYGSEFGVVVEDKALREASQNAGIRCWSSLRDFLTSTTAQPLVAEQIIIENKEEVCEHVLMLASQATDSIAKALEKALLAGGYATLVGDHLPGETGEIYLSGIDRPYKVDIEDIEYIGETVFLANIVAEVELMYQYPIYKYDVLDLDRRKGGISALNDHYFEAETTDAFQFSACLELEFSKWQSAPEKVEELKAQLVNPEIGVSELQDFQILINETGS